MIAQVRLKPDDRAGPVLWTRFVIFVAFPAFVIFVTQKDN